MHPRMLANVALTAALLSPAVSGAYKIECWNSFDTLVCNDGTRVGCTSPGPVGTYYQRDCTHDDAGEGCRSHGGLRELDPGDGQEAVLSADYLGLLPLAGGGDEGDINSSVVATLVATCSDGRSFRCDDQRTSCPRSHAEIAGRCRAAGGLKSATAFTAFSPTRH